MKAGVQNSIFLGILYCFVQTFGEAIAGYIITDVRRISNINFEGAMLFGIIRIILTCIPFVSGFVIVDKLTKFRLKPSSISFVLNFLILVYFYYSGMIQQDPESLIAGSILVSVIFIVIDLKFTIRHSIFSNR